MAAIPYHVAEAFKRKETARAGAFVSVGDALYSYGLKLAYWDGDTPVLAYERGMKAPSVTTARHMRATEAVIARCGIPALCRGGYR